jgi:hypothetical protein
MFVEWNYRRNLGEIQLAPLIDEHIGGKTLHTGVIRKSKWLFDEGPRDAPVLSPCQRFLIEVL